MLRDNKGISLITAVMTVLVIIIILSTITYTAINNTKVKKINEFYNDLREVTDAVQVYYAKHNKLPVEAISYTVTASSVIKEENGSYETFSSIESADLSFILKSGKTTFSSENLYNANDYDASGDTAKAVYYKVDLAKLDNLTLSNSDGTYLVNEKSKTVYYSDGVNVDGKVYNKLPLTYIDAVPAFALVFMLAAGTATVYLTKEKATTVQFPEENPTQEGKVFTGWYYDEDCTNEAKEGDKLIENTNLYAGWNDPLITNKQDGNDVYVRGTSALRNDSITFTTSKEISSCTILEVNDVDYIDETNALGAQSESSTLTYTGSDFIFEKDTSNSYAAVLSNFMHENYDSSVDLMTRKIMYMKIRIDFTDGTYETDDFILHLEYTCMVEGTQISLADGTKKNIEDITYEDELLVWDFDNGCLASSKPLWIQKKQIALEYNLLKFENGSELKTVNQHRIFNKDAGKFTYPMTDETPVGTVTVTSDGTETKLVSKEKVREVVNYYNIITDYHMNLFASDILTSCRLSNLYEIKDMKYVKDGRELASREEYSSIPEEYFKGLRIAEQPREINRGNDVKFDDTLEGYVQRLIKNKK